MGRALDILFLIVVNVASITILYISGEIFPTLNDKITETGDNIGIYSGQAAMTNMQEALFLWVPLIAIAGSWGIVFVREYRRQRLEAARLQGPRV